MARPLELCIVLDPQYMPDDMIRIEVNGQVQPDRVAPWGAMRQGFGFGFGHPATTPFGVWAIPGSDTLFGSGRFGQGDGYLIHRTLRAFVAGDYTVRFQSVDTRPEAGNASAWSEPVLVQHRPAPAAPKNLRIEAGSLRWHFSDP